MGTVIHGRYGAFFGLCDKNVLELQSRCYMTKPAAGLNTRLPCTSDHQKTLEL